MDQTLAAQTRCRVCSRALPAGRTQRYCTGCLERLAALAPERRHGVIELLWLGVNVMLIAGAIVLIVFALAVLPIWLAAQVGPAGFLSYFLILPAGAAFGSALERAGLRVPARRRKSL
jgi:hypothetical protein